MTNLVRAGGVLAETGLTQDWHSRVVGDSL